MNIYLDFITVASRNFHMYLKIKVFNTFLNEEPHHATKFQNLFRTMLTYLTKNYELIIKCIYRSAS